MVDDSWLNPGGGEPLRSLLSIRKKDDGPGAQMLLLAQCHLHLCSSIRCRLQPKLQLLLATCPLRLLRLAFAAQKHERLFATLADLCDAVDRLDSATSLACVAAHMIELENVVASQASPLDNLDNLANEAEAI